MDIDTALKVSLVIGAIVAIGTLMWWLDFLSRYPLPIRAQARRSFSCLDRQTSAGSALPRRKSTCLS